VQTKFLHEIGTMAFNSLRAKVQQASNIFVRLAFGKQLPKGEAAPYRRGESIKKVTDPTF